MEALVLYVALTLAIICPAGGTIIVLAFLRQLRERDAASRLERTAAATRYDEAQARHAARLDRMVVQHTEQVEALFRALRDAQESRRDEIADLLQRIQAPEHAVVQHAQQQAGRPDAVLPMTDEEAAEREQSVRAAIERIERLENEPGMLP